MASDKSNTDGGPLYNGYYSEVARTTKDEVTPGHMVEQSYDNGVEDDSYATVDELRDCYVVAICWAEANISRSAPLVTKSLATSKRPSPAVGAADEAKPIPENLSAGTIKTTVLVLYRLHKDF
ncbi:hypothetical protein PPACK8108_LOCUS25369 [Phakopsora pachyrhizi]|uniref:Uncharacterized protein n=1 Tax=Phakopsora pachyrhizi TaxID=170000 RepID=A0AAV0BRV7_PHAPC|nr:hypothetical protein PPACK8108_LOCUS25369 [Phakopsora pachyrhizi]